jgi:hypothetical protein
VKAGVLSCIAFCSVIVRIREDREWNRVLESNSSTANDRQLWRANPALSSTEDGRIRFSKLLQQNAEPPIFRRCEPNSKINENSDLFMNIEKLTMNCSGMMNELNELK